MQARDWGSTHEQEDRFLLPLTNICQAHWVLQSWCLEHSSEQDKQSWSSQDTFSNEYTSGIHPWPGNWKTFLSMSMITWVEKLTLELTSRSWWNCRGTKNISLKVFSGAQQGGWAKGACSWAWRLEFYPRRPHGGRWELTAVNCPLLHKDMVPCVCMCTLALKTNKQTNK